MRTSPRHLIALIVVLGAGAAIWATSLRSAATRSDRSTAATAHGLNGAIAAAHAAVATSNGAVAAHGGTVPPAAGAPAKPAPAASRAAATAAASTTARAQAATTRARSARAHPGHHTAAPLDASARLQLVARALARRQVLAMLFYNPAGADDRLVRRELELVPTRQGRVTKLSVPLSELARYSIVTQQVPVTGSPTLVIVDRARGATELVGFADGFEISQRIDDALAVR